MALSNWDTAALDEKGRPTNGVFVSPNGVEVRFYKNWIYVSDKRFRPIRKTGLHYCLPTIMQVQEGDLSYDDVHIHAFRGPQQGIFAVVSSRIYRGKGKRMKTREVGMVGAGVYGFTFRGRWVGVSKTTLQWFRRELNRMGPVRVDRYKTIDAKGKRKVICIRGRDPIHQVDEWARKIDWKKGLRFNQGDAFFQRACKTPITGTKAGKAGAPMILQGLRRRKGGNRRGKSK